MQWLVAAILVLILATLLGFGGLVGLDPRALAGATLGAVLALLALRGGTPVDAV